MVARFTDLEVERVGERRDHREQQRQQQRFCQSPAQEDADEVEAHIHHRPAEHNAERKVRGVVLVLAAAARKVERKRGTARKPAQEPREPDSLARPHDLDQHVAHKPDARNEHHEQPYRMRVQHRKARRAVGLVRQERQYEGGNHRELDRREDILLRKLLREGMQLFLRRKHPEHHDHDDARFQQAPVPADSPEQIDNQHRDARRNPVTAHRGIAQGRIWPPVANRERHVHRHQEHAHHHETRDERGGSPHLVGKQGRHRPRKPHERKRTHAGRMPVRLVRIRMFALHADNEADAYRRRQTVEYVKVKHISNLHKTLQKGTETSANHVRLWSISPTCGRFRGAS